MTYFPWPVVLTMVVLLLVMVGLAFWLLRSGALGDKSLKGVAEAHNEAAAAAGEPDDAPWMGETGLAPDEERMVSDYMRVQLEESFYLEGSLRARDLSYRGKIRTGDDYIWFWEIKNRFEKPTYAYVWKSAELGTSYGFGDISPDDYR